MAEPTSVSPDGAPIILDLDGLDGNLSDLAALERRRRPTIGVVRERCEGFALAAAMAVDLVVAAPRATFGRPGRWSPVVLRRGEGVVGRRVVGYLVMTRRLIGTSTAQAWGLVSHVADDPTDKADQLRDLIASRSTVAVTTILRQAHRGAAAHYLELRAVSPLGSDELGPGHDSKTHV